MRLSFAAWFLLFALPAGADSMRLSIGARVLDRCRANPTATAPRLSCRAAPRLTARYEYLRTAAATTVTILF